MLVAEPLYLGVNRGDAIFQHPKLAQIREPLALRFLTRGAFGVVAPLFLFPGVHRDEQVANPLMCDAADVPPAWTLPQQADEFRVSMTATYRNASKYLAIQAEGSPLKSPHS